MKKLRQIYISSVLQSERGKWQKIKACPVGKFLAEIVL